MVHNAARAYIGCTGQLDFVFESSVRKLHLDCEERKLGAGSPYEMITVSAHATVGDYAEPQVAEPSLSTLRRTFLCKADSDHFWYSGVFTLKLALKQVVMWMDFP